MTSVQLHVKDNLLLWGWAAILFSTSVFCIPSLTVISPEQYLLFFAFHFGFAILYHFVVFFNKRTRADEHMIHYRAIKLVLLLISAYALNREMEVFAASPAWFSVVLVVLCVNYLAAAYFVKAPRWLKQLSFFVYGISTAVFIYLAVYLLPLYFISLPGLLVLGISVHTFVPLLFCFLTYFLIRRLAQEDCRYWIGFSAGVAAVVFVCIGFAVSWDNKVHNLNRQYTSAMEEGEDKLPLWVQVAQKVDRDAVTEMILKTGLIYKTPQWAGISLFNLPSRTFGDQQQLHDPLVTLAAAFSDNVLLPEEDRIKILENQYNARHQALERLWSGENLKTEQVSTNVRVWPHLRLAYTEKLLTVYNHRNNRGWNNQGEGIYTFHMPEGAVVTSLSLWVNGKEEKGILTSKQTATTAYRTIVGYERRDPSVVHWQEGNTVSVRVFPVVAESSRTFKIGITAPLRKEGIELMYDNIWFDGPDASTAEETIKLELAEGQPDLVQHASFAPGKKRAVTKTGPYQPRWTVSFRDKGLQGNTFSFNGNQYSMRPYERQRVPTFTTDVYLDINQSWTPADLQEVWKTIGNKRVWVYDNEMQAVTEENREEILPLLQKQSFSLFPFHLVKNREQTVIISKSGAYSPTIFDLEGCSFLKSLQAKLDNEHRVKLFLLGTEMSPFIRSLKERRCFDFENGGTELLTRLLTNNRFTQDHESDAEVIVHSADVVITKQPGETASSAPDHLMRLFAYNHIMQQWGRKDSTPEAVSNAVVKEAEEAYVVSPVSSLIVLETQQDYDRFGIKDGENSLKNASLNNKGAVPEPGEWAVIILLASAFLLFVYKTKIA